MLALPTEDPVIRGPLGHWIYLGGAPICPDLLRLEHLGEADNARGRFVRALFWVLDRVWPVR